MAAAGAVSLCAVVVEVYVHLKGYTGSRAQHISAAASFAAAATFAAGAAFAAAAFAGAVAAAIQNSCEGGEQHSWGV